MTKYTDLEVWRADAKKMGAKIDAITLGNRITRYWAIADNEQVLGFYYESRPNPEQNEGFLSLEKTL